MRARWTPVVLSLAVCAVFVPAGAANADRNSKNGEVITSGTLDGFDNPPGADKNEFGYVNPCLGHGEYEVHVSRPTGLVKNDVDQVSVEVGGDVIKIEATGAPGGSIGFSLSIDDTFQVEYVQWLTGCGPTSNASEGELEPGNTGRYWIKRPTQGAIVPDLLAEVAARLPAPDIIWPNADPEFGWIYVNTDNDVRIGPVSNVRRSTTISNLAGSVTAWVEASPSTITFHPGEPGKRDMSCSYDAATAPFVIERATSCFYRYTNSSAISTEADSAFVARTSIAWTITSSGPLTYSNPLSWREELIQVAEVQALEIAP